MYYCVLLPDRSMLVCWRHLRSLKEQGFTPPEIVKPLPAVKEKVPEVVSWAMTFDVTIN